MSVTDHFSKKKQKDSKGSKKAYKEHKPPVPDPFKRLLPVTPEFDNNAPHTTQVSSSEKYTTYVRALKDFKDLVEEGQADVNEELASVKEGDYIRVIKRRSRTIWKGEKGGKEGIFNPELTAPFLSHKLRALWRRSTDKLEELDFLAGEILAVLCPHTDPWWVWCEYKNQVGLVPFNYMECIPPHGKDDNPDPSTLSPEVLEVIEVTNDPKDRVICRARAQWDYDGTEDRDLDLKEGDIVDVLSRFAEEWWFGCIEGRMGIFPKVFVTEELDPLIYPTREIRRPPWNPYYVKVLYDSAGEKSNGDLDLVKDDIIEIEWMCDDQWWRGRAKNGDIGWFPCNYVTSLLDKRMVA